MAVVPLTVFCLAAGCAASPAVSSSKVPPPGSSTGAAAISPRAPLDSARVAAIIGGKAEAAGKSVKFSFPRTDVAVEVDGWSMPPFMGLTSWVTFTPGEKAGVDAMLMGDLVVFEDEVNAVMSALLEGGVEVTALHNHFFFDKPKVLFMHVGGEGSVETLGKAVKAALDVQRSFRAKAPQPGARFEGGVPPSTNSIDAAKLDTVFGIKGTSKDGMYKAVMGRKATASCGCAVGKSEGVNTWAAFGGADDNAVVDGDFAVTESELQPVLKSLRSSGINIVAIHHHMTGETPRILFLHYWGRNNALELAGAVKRALDLTAWDRP